GGESDFGLLQAASGWKAAVADLRQQLSDYLGPTSPGVEIVNTENNSVAYNPGKQTTSLVNGLYLGDSIGNVLQTELKGLIWWDVRNSPDGSHNNSANLYSWRQYGDYGIFNTVNDPYPTYYVSKLLAQFARGGDKVVPVGSDYS